MDEKTKRKAGENATPRAVTSTAPAKPRKAGRPKATIDWQKVDVYLKAGCSGAGIAGLLGIHPNTLYETCKRDKKCDLSAYSQQKREVGLDMIRFKQFDKAMKGDTSMLIWLGKQYLGQKDKIENDNNTTVVIEQITGMIVK